MADHLLKQQALALAEAEDITYLKALRRLQHERQLASPEYKLVSTLQDLVNEFGLGDVRNALAVVAVLGVKKGK